MLLSVCWLLINGAIGTQSPPALTADMDECGRLSVLVYQRMTQRLSSQSSQEELPPRKRIKARMIQQASYHESHCNNYNVCEHLFIKPSAAMVESENCFTWENQISRIAYDDGERITCDLAFEILTESMRRMTDEPPIINYLSLSDIIWGSNDDKEYKRKFSMDIRRINLARIRATAAETAAALFDETISGDEGSRCVSQAMLPDIYDDSEVCSSARVYATEDAAELSDDGGVGGDAQDDGGDGSHDDDSNDEDDDGSDPSLPPRIQHAIERLLESISRTDIHFVNQWPKILYSDSIEGEMYREVDGYVGGVISAVESVEGPKMGYMNIIRSTIRQSGEFRKWAWTNTMIMEYVCNNQVMSGRQVGLLLTSVASFVHLFNSAMFHLGIHYTELFMEFEKFVDTIVGYSPLYMGAVGASTWYLRLGPEFVDALDVPSPRLELDEISRENVEFLLQDEEIPEDAILTVLDMSLQHISSQATNISDHHSVRIMALMFHVIRFYHDEEYEERFLAIQGALSRICDRHADLLNHVIANATTILPIWILRQTVGNILRFCNEYMMSESVLSNVQTWASASRHVPIRPLDNRIQIFLRGPPTENKDFLVQTLDHFSTLSIQDLAGEINVSVYANPDGSTGPFPGGIGAFYSLILGKIFDHNNGYFRAVLLSGTRKGPPRRIPTIRVIRLSHYTPTNIKIPEHYRAIGRIIAMTLRAGNPENVLDPYIRSPSATASVNDALFFNSNHNIKRGFYDIFHYNTFRNLFRDGENFRHALRAIGDTEYTFSLESDELISDP